MSFWNRDLGFSRGSLLMQMSFVEPANHKNLVLLIIEQFHFKIRFSRQNRVDGLCNRANQRQSIHSENFDPWFLFWLLLMTKFRFSQIKFLKAELFTSVYCQCAHIQYIHTWCLIPLSNSQEKTVAPGNGLGRQRKEWRLFIASNTAIVESWETRQFCVLRGVGVDCGSEIG